LSLPNEKADLQMIYRLVGLYTTPTGRRIAACFAFLGLAVAIPITIVLGTIFHLLSSGKGYLSDLRDMLTKDIPAIGVDLIKVIITGKQI
jgi:hypothetical protein